jgi:3-mercaptopyruvate sulfurtransferase SseA
MNVSGDLLPRQLPRWQQLMTPAWLDALISGRPTIAAPLGNWRLLEVGCNAAESFLRRHIPSAGYIETHELERGPLWNKVPDGALLQVLLAKGIRHDTTVLLYGRNTLCAARAAHLMLYAGVEDVRLLDGGFRAWEAAACPVLPGMPSPHARASDFGVSFPAHPEYLMDMQQVKERMRRQDGVLVSIRTWNEFIGKTSGYSYIAAKGDIPGARWGRAGDDGDVNSMSDFHRADGTMKPAAEIQAFWEKAGICAGQRTTFYCGTGWRASLAFFYAWLMNWRRISVYDGGWFEFSSDPTNLLATGARPDRPGRPGRQRMDLRSR